MPDATDREKLLEQNMDMFMTRVVGSRADAAWALAALAALAAFAVEFALCEGLWWGVGAATIPAFFLGGIFKTYRFKAGMASAQLRLAGGLVIGAVAFGLFGLHARVSTCALGAVGLAKLVRELVVYVGLRRRMVALNMKRKVRAANLVPNAVGLAIGGSTVYFALTHGGTMEFAALGAWLAGYSLLGAAMELWG
jgi:hypothetical protein